MARGGGGSSIKGDDIAALALVGGVVYLYATDQLDDLITKAKEVLDSIGGKVSERLPPIPTPGGGGGGLTGSVGSTGSCGKTIYPATGRAVTAGKSGKSTRNYASGGSGVTAEWNAGGVPFAAYEATGYFNIGRPSKGDDNISIKMWGPTHSDGNCCWCMFEIFFNGQTSSGGEGPHPETDKTQIRGANIGSIVSKWVGVKGVIWPISGGAHMEGWVDTGNGQWRKVVEKNGPCGHQKKSTRPASGQQVQFRIDEAPQVQARCAVVQEIRPPGVGGAGAGVSARFASAREVAPREFNPINTTGLWLDISRANDCGR